MRIKEKTFQPEDQKVIGSQLKHLREEKGLTLEQVSQETKISLSNLRAMEEHDFAKLPADTFTKGLLILYGNFLGEDGQLMATRFITERHATGRKSDRSFRKTTVDHTLTPKKMAEPSHIPSATVAAALFSLIAISFTLFCLYTSWNPFTFFTGTTQNITSSIMAVFDDTPTEESTYVRGERIEVKVEFIQDGSVEVNIDDQPTAHQAFVKSQKGHWLAEEKLLLRFSDPGIAELMLNGQPLPFPEDHSGQFLIQLEKASAE
ncbi:MAG: hypothetical protein CSB34_05040 [Desulfobulbus propionicus]|nr:MAG: hypothetical protein CSB34_05040 [Desulfobulbus propionicus]